MSERRGFMFIDMNSATKMAEQLGHSQYSAMLKFCFKLLEEEICRYQWHEIYQFVGDEAVITWQDTPKARKIHNHQLFEGFKSRLRQHSSYFQKTFGATPTFKCAIHIGEVIKTQMGGQNQQIAYHGDAVNTTSRILDLCHQMGTDLLLSTPYFEAYVAGKASGQFLQTAPVQLNGKQMPLSLFKPKPCLVNQAHIHPFYSQKMTISQNQPS